MNTLLRKLLVAAALTTGLWVGVLPAVHARADISELGDISDLRDPQMYVDIEAQATRWTSSMSTIRWSR